MKKISAKLKLTIWTTLLLILMASILMALMLSMSDNIIASNSREQLLEIVDDNADELEFDDGELDLDDVDYYKKGVYTLLYSEDGEFLSGNFAEEQLISQLLNDKKVTETTVDDTLYYVYDVLTSVEKSDMNIWVRGIIAVDEVASATTSIMQMALFSLPVFIILGAIGSYFISKNTFKPIDKLIKTAEEISDSENLSLRINLEGASAEIQKLAYTYDNMFERLENSFEAERQFTSDVSHELRTPTAVILAQCEYALGKNVLKQDKQEALETVQRQAMKMSKLISNLLSLTRLDSGVEKAEYSCVNLSDIIGNICSDSEVIAPKGIKLNYDVTPNITGKFDEAMITRLLENLLSNAFSYSKDKGEVNVTLNENTENIILTVKDDGIGISQEHQAKIWHRFYQVDASRTASQNGSMGLGLAMVAQIAKLHNAKIEVQSEPLKGSTFIVSFPKQQ